MAKTNPIGVRFDVDLLTALKEDKIADSPQKVLNFLTGFYHEHRPRTNFSKKLETIPIKKRVSKMGKYEAEKKVSVNPNNEILSQIKILEEEYNLLPDVGLGLKRKRFLATKIEGLKML